MQSTTTRDHGQWTIRDVLAWTAKKFAEMSFPTPLLDAQLLLGQVLGLDKVQLYMQMDRPLSLEERSNCRGLVQRRIAGEPVAYILGKKHWHDLELYVDGKVLIPRPETESLLDFVLAVLQHAEKSPKRILDLCTGSGCLAIALARRFPDAKITGVDVSAAALSVFEQNLTAYGLQNVEMVHGDVTDPKFFKNLICKNAPFDVVVANPPYLSEQEWLKVDIGVRKYEPKEALVSNGDGLEIARKIVEYVSKHDVLEAESVFVMETGIGQGRILAKGCCEPAQKLEAFSFHVPIWDLPRSMYFCLRDLEAKERFFCRIQGMHMRSRDSVSDVDSNLHKS